MVVCLVLSIIMVIEFSTTERERTMMGVVSSGSRGDEKEVREGKLEDN